MSFNNISGHQFQKDYLLKSIQSGKVASSYLFYGRDGIGKKMAALEFAKLLNCLNDKGNDIAAENSCTCSSCMKIDNMSHPDITIIKPEDSTEIKVKQVREYVEDLIYLRPYEGRYKVFIVDEADTMNVNAQNSFLKTLEEPPKDAVIVLISGRPQHLLKTILSRCQKLEYFKLPDEIIREAIAKSTQLPKQHIDLAVKISCGSMSRALSIDEQFLADRQNIISTVSQLNSENSVYLQEFVQNLTADKDGDSVDIFFETIYLWLKDLLHIKCGSDHSTLIHSDCARITENFSTTLSTDKIIEMTNYLERCRTSLIKSNVNKQYVMENLAAEFAGI